MDSINPVDTFIAGLDHPRKAEIEALRAIILSADPDITELIKWNAPSFYFKDDFATFRLQPKNTLQIVFHKGAKAKDNSTAVEIDDPAGLLKWVAKDRCVVSFSDMDDVQAKQAALVDIVRQWIRQM